VHLPSPFLHLPVLQLLFHLDRIDEGGRGVLKDDELVGYDTVNDLLLLVLGDIVEVTSLMELCLAAGITFHSV